MARILVADDEALFRTAIIRDLKKLGHDVVAACASGEEAVAKAKELNPDIFLLDIHMETKFAGIDACKTINLNDPEAKVLFISGYSRANFENYLEEVQFHGYLEKIFTLPMLESVLNSIYS